MNLESIISGFVSVIVCYFAGAWIHRRRRRRKIIFAEKRELLSGYDEKFARQVKRRKITTQDDLACHLCTSNHTNTASEYEFPCLILNGWICETHCVEITDGPSDDDLFGSDTRILVYQSLGGESLESIGAKEAYNRLMKTCNRCPYHGRPI